MKRSTLLIFISFFFNVLCFGQWALQSNPLGNSDNAMLGKVQFVSPTEGWIECGSNGSLLHTTNSGNTWNLVTPYPSDKVASMSDPALGMSWINQNTGWVSKFYFEQNNQNEDGIYCANGAVIYKTTDAGSTWTKHDLPRLFKPLSYSLSDLSGTWEVHMINVNNPTISSQTNNWSYGTLTLDNSGGGSVNLIKNTGDVLSQQSITPLKISTRGEIASTGDDDIQGFMNSDKNMVIATETDGDGSYNLMVWQKVNPDVTYSSADFEGKWQMHSLDIGGSSSNGSDWAYSEFTSDASGNMTGTINNPGGGAGQQVSMTATMDSVGKITNLTNVASVTYGFMSPDKQTCVILMKMSDNNGSGLNLVFLQKENAQTTYHQSDLLGLWQNHSVVVPSLEQSTNWADWEHNEMIIDSTGNTIVTGRVANGENQEETEGQLQLAADGTFQGFSDKGDRHGFLCPDKSLAIYTVTDGSGGFQIGVMQRDSSICGDATVQVQFADDNTGWATVFNQLYSTFRAYKTTDGGTNWTQITGKDNPVGGLFDFVNDKEGWLVGNVGNVGEETLNNIYHSTDGGLSWTLQKTGIGDAKAIDFSDSLNGWVVGRNALILKTNDGGAHWTKLTNTNQIDSAKFNAVYALDSAHVWFGCENPNYYGPTSGLIVKTNDGGNSWKTEPVPVANGIFSIYFTDENNGWITGDQGQIAYFSPSNKGLTPIVPDSSTVLLDHFDGTTPAEVVGTPSFVPGPYGLGKAISFTSMNNYLIYTLNGTLTYKGTVELWIYPKSYGKGILNINWNHTYSYPANGHVFHLMLDSVGRIALSDWEATGNKGYKSNGSVPLNAWSHIAVSWGDSTKIFINGKVDFKTINSFNPPISGTTYAYLPYWGADNFGYVDELQISDVQRPDAQIISRVAQNSVQLSIDVTAGNLHSLITGNQRNNVIGLQLSGTMDARDFKFIRDSLPVLDKLDLSKVKVVAYDGPDGTVGENYHYAENTLPRNALLFKTSLTAVMLPDSLVALGRSSLNGCKQLTAVDIPQSVSIIDSMAFRSCQNLTKIPFPASLTKIGYAAFFNSGIKEANLPEGLTTLGDYALQSCYALTSITLPSTVTRVGYCAITFDNSLKAINVAENNQYYASNDGVLYDKSLQHLVAFPAGKTSYYQVPEGVVSLDTAAFEGDAYLKNVSLPSTLTNVSSEAFYYCVNLNSIEIPQSVSAIGSYAFYNCSKLTGIKVNTMTPVDLSASDSVFKYVDLNNCILAVPTGAKAAYQSANQWGDFVNIVEDVMKTVTITSGNLHSALSAEEKMTVNDLIVNGTMDARDFRCLRDSLPALTSLDISGVSITAYTGVHGTLNGQQVTYPADTLPTYAFYSAQTNVGRATLKRVILPTTITSIGSAAFTNCGLREINIPNNVTSIQSWAFAACSNMFSVSIPASVSEIGMCAFAYENGLNNFTVDENNPDFTTLDGVLFSKDMKTIVSYPDGRPSQVYEIPDGVTTIESAFVGWSVEQVKIPNTVTDIGERAFNDCSNLRDIYIPASVTNIGTNAFAGCTALSFITVNNPVPIDLTNSQDVFLNVDKSNCILQVPVGSVQNYQSAYQWSDFTHIREFATGTDVISADQPEIYPNPANSVITVNRSQPTDILIFDLTGKLLINKTIVKGEYVDVSSLTNGIYFVKIATNDGYVLRKLIKN